MFHYQQPPFTGTGETFQVDTGKTETMAGLKAQLFAANGGFTSREKVHYSGNGIHGLETFEGNGSMNGNYSASSPYNSGPYVAPKDKGKAPDRSGAYASPSPASAFTGTTSPPLFGSSPPPQMQNEIQQLAAEIGYPPDQVLKALQASSGDPQKAVEYLMNGIPQQPPRPEGPFNWSSTPASSDRPATDSFRPFSASQRPNSSWQDRFTNGSGKGEWSRFDNTGSTTGSGFSGTGASNPALDAMTEKIHNLARQNRGKFMWALDELFSTEPAFADSFSRVCKDRETGERSERRGDAGGVVGRVVDDKDLRHMRQANCVEFTPDDDAAISRLEDIGFPRKSAIDAYLECDKHEGLAADYLCEGRFEN